MQDKAAIFKDIIARYKQHEGPLLPILHAIQDEFEFIPSEAIQYIADGLNLSRADVHGVMSFYHDFRQQAPGKNILKLCRAEACQSMGGKNLSDQIMQKYNIDWHKTTTDNSLTLEPVFCLGLCANGPAAMLNDKPMVELDIDILDHHINGIST